MAIIDIKLKSYDELIFEITKLNIDKYLLEKENKQLKERIDKAIEEIKSRTDYEVRFKKLLEILGDKQ